MPDKECLPQMAINAIKHIHMAKTIMMTACGSTLCGTCPFKKRPQGCIVADMEDVLNQSTSLKRMFYELDHEPKHSKRIKEDDNANQNH